MPRKQVLPKMLLGWKVMKGRTWPWAALFVPGFPTANPFMSSHHDVSLPEGHGRWEGSTSAILLSPAKALPAVSAISETGPCSFLLFSVWFFGFFFFFLGSHTFYKVKISWLCPYWRKSGLRGNQSIKFRSAGTFRWSFLAHTLPAQAWQLCIAFLSLYKISHFGCVQTCFTFSFVSSLHPLVLGWCFKAFSLGGLLGQQYQMKLKLHPHSKLETSQ